MAPGNVLDIIHSPSFPLLLPPIAFLSQLLVMCSPSLGTAAQTYLGVGSSTRVWVASENLHP